MFTKSKLQGALLLAATLGSAPAFASVDQVRVVWGAGNASSEAIIAFSRVSGSTSTTGSQYINIGTSTNSASWTKNTTFTKRTFASSLDSYFFKLTGLQADTEYYFQVCDASGCNADKYFFRTAPTSAQGMTFITGGDSRTNTTTRRQGNRLVSKIRPHAVFFSGDLTDSHTQSEVSTWLTHWKDTFTATTIDGISFKQVYPLIPAVGNHESYSDEITPAQGMMFTCSVFGIDADNNGSCSLRDTYFATQVGSLTRFYTLNSHLYEEGETTEHASQRTWLSSDLAANSTSASWRMAQYHHPMFPRDSGKGIYDSGTGNQYHQGSLHFAQPFYDYKMNLVNESDTHLVKMTYPVTPNGKDYTKATAGTIYIGEGAWGAPTRTPDVTNSWIVDQASFSHLNVLLVTPTDMTVKTVQFSGEASTTTLSRDARNADPLALPSGISYWNAKVVGTTGMCLKRNASNYSTMSTGCATSIGGGTTPPPTPTTGVLVNGVAQSNISGAKDSKTYWTMEVPSGATNLKFTTSGGTGDADLYAKLGSAPTSTDNACKSEAGGNIETCTPATATAGTWHVMLSGYDAYSGLTIKGEYTLAPAIPSSLNLTNQSGAAGSWTYHTIEVPVGTVNLLIMKDGGTGDSDLYLKAGSQPTKTSYTMRKTLTGNKEHISLQNPQPGTWHIGVYGYKAYSGISLTANVR